jgi:hypothetical protein
MFEYNVDEMLTIISRSSALFAVGTGPADTDTGKIND